MQNHNQNQESGLPINEGQNIREGGQPSAQDGDKPLQYEVTDKKHSIPPIQKIQQKQQKEQDQRKDFSRVSSSSSSLKSDASSQSNQEKLQYQSIKEGQQNQPKQQLNQAQQTQGLTQHQVQKLKKNDRVIRYKYCCKKCKHADRDKDKKACVCVVPRDQRRTHLGCQGCQTCGCTGCSKQDFIFRGQDPQYHPEDKKQQVKKKQISQNFEARNGCCKNCMKAFSKSNKSCICQVPENVRKTKLSSSGCKICGCTGCNPEDRKGNHKSEKKVKRSRSRSQKRKEKRERRSHSKQRKKRSKSRSPQIIDTYAMNFNNIDRSIIGSMIINEYQIDPALLGFGIPQRSSSYLLGQNRQK